MSKIFPGRVSTFLLVLFLAACGGDDKSSRLLSPGDLSGGDPLEVDVDAEQTDPEITLALGTGSEDSFMPGQIQTDIKNLPFRGTSLLTVSIVNEASGNSLFTDQDVEVAFSSGCIINGTVSIDPPIITASGIATTTYTAGRCFPSDTVTDQMFVSSSRDPSLALNPGPEDNQFCASVSVVDASGNRIHPPTGTSVAFSITEGTILSAQKTRIVLGTALPSDKAQFLTCVFAKPEDDAVPATLTATATTPGNTFAEDLIDI